MEESKTKITVQVVVNSPVEHVWQCWTSAEAISKWNNASDDWHTPYVDNNVKPGATFVWRMEAKDGSFGFDFSGVYDQVVVYKLLEYTLGDSRRVKVEFVDQGKTTAVVETFEAESQNPLELQQKGWQAILDNFKKYAEHQKNKLS